MKVGSGHTAACTKQGGTMKKDEKETEKSREVNFGSLEQSGHTDLRSRRPLRKKFSDRPERNLTQMPFIQVPRDL